MPQFVVMRGRRVRFTQSRARSSAIRDRAVKTLEGVSAYRNSLAGRSVKAERLAEQWRTQNHLCEDCGSEMALGDCKFKNRKWDKDTINPAVHKHCKSGRGDAYV